MDIIVRPTPTPEQQAAAGARIDAIPEHVTYGYAHADRLAALTARTGS